MGHMRLHLEALLRIERSLPNRQEAELLRVEHRVRSTRHVCVRLLRQGLQHRGLVLGHHTRLVGGDDALDPGAQALQLLLEPPVDLRQGAIGPRPAAHRRQLVGRVLELHRTLNEVEPGLDHFELAGHELFGLDEDVLPHADLAEVVEQTCVAELLELVVSHVYVAILPSSDLSHGVGESGRQRLNATRVTGGARISLLDRGHARLHEAVEE